MKTTNLNKGDKLNTIFNFYDQVQHGEHGIRVVMEQWALFYKKETHFMSLI